MKYLGDTVPQIQMSPQIDQFSNSIPTPPLIKGGLWWGKGAGAGGRCSDLDEFVEEKDLAGSLIRRDYNI